MRNKKKSKKKSAAPVLNPSETVLMSSLLKDLGNQEPARIVAKIPDASLAKILVEHLPLDGSSVSLLSAINEEFQDKQVRKAVKRVLFKLENKGVSVSGFHSGGETQGSVLKPPEKEEPVAFLGPLDMMGTRPVLITLDRTMKGLDGGIGIVSDEEGIQHFVFGTFSKKWLKGIKEQMSQEMGPFVETSLAHAATILEDAYRQHLEIHSEAPGDYLELRPRLLDKVSTLDAPHVYEFISEDSISQGLLTNLQIDKLFQHELMTSWVVAFDEIRLFMEDISKVEDSPIVLSESQKAARIREIEEKCMREIFPAPKRVRMKRRLEEMAYVFFKLGQEDISRLSLAAALSMDEEESILRTNPVIEHLVKRSLDLYRDMIDEEEAGEGSDEDFKSPSSEIITP